MASKTLIIYYSRSGQNYSNGSVKELTKGNTEIIVEYMKKYLDADIFKVETLETYSLDYYKCLDDAKLEIIKEQKPELKSYLETVSEYENIIVAGPSWWGTFPMAIFSLLEKLDFEGKKIYPVVTHEGSGMANTKKFLIRYCKNGEVQDGLAIHGSNVSRAEGNIKEWIKNNIN